MPYHGKDKPIFLPDILLPNPSVDLTKWAVVACDQFTSNPSYWQELRDFIGDAPSTYKMILPEVYLEQMNDDMIDQINQSMHRYIDQGIFESIGPSMMLIERTSDVHMKRLGLIMAIDLEAYSFEPGATPMVRTTEKTILDRIPPRVRIRKEAPLELSHVMLLIDDPINHIIERLYEKRASFHKSYDFALNMSGGHLRGYQITDCQKIIDAFYDLVNDDEDPMLFAVGDGNHSLATAKAHWEKVKEGLSKEERLVHPARFSLVEVVNIYDPGLHFEGIHRVLFHTDPSFLTELFHAVDKEANTWIYTKETGKQDIYIPQSTAEAYEQIQTFIDHYMKKHPEVSIDYIHGEDELISICQKNPHAIGIRMPVLEKKDLFPFIKSGKVLPRKSFSMGSAHTKRYYMEARYIK